MNFCFRRMLGNVAIAAALLFATNAMASVVISGTRVIYSGDDREVSVKLTNMGKLPVLVQSWIDKGDVEAKPESIQVPFVLTPPINRVESGKGQTLRISYTGTELPSDRESVFWLNVLEIPAKKQAVANENFLQMAFRTRIKLFYRPAGLEGIANEAAKKILWSKQGNEISANNASPYFVSLVNVSSGGKSVEGQMLAPRSTKTFKLPASTGGKISGEYVNDYGAVNKFESSIQ